MIGATLLQLSVIATVTLADYSNLGYVAPYYGLGAALEQRTERFEVSVAGEWSPDRKQVERLAVPPFATQFTAGGSAQALAKLGPVLLGPGLSYSYTKSDGWTKDSWRWDVAAGVDVPIEATRLRFLVSHLEPIDDPSNHLRGERYSLRLDVPSGKVMFRPGVDVGFWRFHASGNPDVSYSRRTWAIHLGIAR